MKISSCVCSVKEALSTNYIVTFCIICKNFVINATEAQEVGFFML